MRAAGPRRSWRRSSTPSDSGLRQFEQLTRIDQVRVMDMVAIGAEDRRVADALALGLPRDPPQVVAGLNQIAVTARLRRRGRRRESLRYPVGDAAVSLQLVDAQFERA